MFARLRLGETDAAMVDPPPPPPPRARAGVQRHGPGGWLKAWVVLAAYHVIEGRDAIYRRFDGAEGLVWGPSQARLE